MEERDRKVWKAWAVRMAFWIVLWAVGSLVLKLGADYYADQRKRRDHEELERLERENRRP